MRHTRLIAGLALGTMLTAPAMAQDNMERLGNMQKTDATFTYIPRDDERARQRSRPASTLRSPSR